MSDDFYGEPRPLPEWFKNALTPTRNRPMNNLIKNQEAEIKTLKEINKLQCRDLDDAQRSLEDKHADNVRLKALLRELVGSLHDDISMRGNGWQINRYQKAMKAVKEVLGDE